MIARTSLLLSLALASSGRFEARVEEDSGALGALIERTNELESFVAHYTLESPDKTASIRLVYEAPGRARCDIATDGTAVATTWIVDGVFTVVGSDEKRSNYGRVDLAPLTRDFADQPASRLLDELFPAESDGLDLGPGLTFRFVVNPSGEKIDASFQVNFTQRRERLLEWLRPAPEWVEETAGGEGVRSYSFAERARIDVSTETGFVTAFRRTDDDSKGILLERLELDVEIEASEFEPTPRADHVVDSSEPMRAGMLAGFRTARRGRAYREAAALAGDKDLDDEVLADLGRFFAAHHEEAVRAGVSAWIASSEQRIDEYLERAAKALRADGGASAREAIEREAERSRQALDERAAEFGSKVADGLVAPRSSAAGGSTIESLLALEREAARSAVAAIVGGLRTKLDEGLATVRAEAPEPR